jgi:MFS family permease
VNPYLELLRRNRNFRLLYIGQTVSQLGDWFNAVAVYALLLDLTGSATAVAWMLVVQFMPVAIISPLAGVVVDRIDRRRLMIAADIARGVLILGLLLVRRVDQVWIAYAVMAATVSASAFFEPARTATIPNITTAEELLPANALASATWSAMLALGASIGGIVTAVLGRNVAFAVNAASFFASAAFIVRTRYDGPPLVRRA